MRVSKKGQLQAVTPACLATSAASPLQPHPQPLTEFHLKLAPARQHLWVVQDGARNATLTQHAAHRFHRALKSHPFVIRRIVQDKAGRERLQDGPGTPPATRGTLAHAHAPPPPHLHALGVPPVGHQPQRGRRAILSRRIAGIEPPPLSRRPLAAVCGAISLGRALGGPLRSFRKGTRGFQKRPERLYGHPLRPAPGRAQQREPRPSQDVIADEGALQRVPRSRPRLEAGLLLSFLSLRAQDAIGTLAVLRKRREAPPLGPAAGDSRQLHPVGLPLVSAKSLPCLAQIVRMRPSSEMPRKGPKRPLGLPARQRLQKGTDLLVSRCREVLRRKGLQQPICI